MQEYTNNETDNMEELIRAAHEAVEDELVTEETPNGSVKGTEDTAETAEPEASESKAAKFKALLTKLWSKKVKSGYASKVDIPVGKRLGTKIILILAALAVIFTGISTYNMISLSNTKKKQASLNEECIPLMQQGPKINEELFAIRDGMTRYILVTDADARRVAYDAYYSSYTNVQDSIRNLNKMSKEYGDEKLIGLAAEFEEIVSVIAKHTYNEMTLTTAGYYDQAYADFLELDPIFARSSEVVEEINDYLNEILSETADYIAGRTKTMQMFTYISFLIYVILIVVAVVFVIVMLVNPAKEACGHVSVIIDDISNGEGNLTERLTVEREDEIGQLAIGINGFIENLQGIMKTLKKNAEDIVVSVDKCSDSIRNSNDSADNISATLEELAASMQEVASTVTQLLADSENIRSRAQSMNVDAENSKNMVGTIKERAVRVNSEIKANKQNAEKMLAEIGETLKIAVEESANVSRINALTEEILQIASQTNLLSLNASIEAARAGEAGRGFAVVAEEIRNLADGSKQTASGIREISEIVNAAVSKLANTSERLMNYVQSDVIRDYEGFVDFADQYRGDADEINKIFTGFADGLGSMSRTIDGMVESIDSITRTVEASSQGVCDAAESANELVGEFAGINVQVENNRVISESLAAEVGKFKQV